MISSIRPGNLMNGKMNEARMFAALNATNEAILKTDVQEELFQRVCDAAVHGGGFKSAAALLVAGDGWLRFVAVSGHDGGTPLSEIRISVDAASERGKGLAGPAFRTCRSCITNDFQNDERVRPWRENGGGGGIGAAAAVPILSNGSSIGVFLFYLDEAGSLTGEIVGLMERMVENVSFALRNFERDRERKQAEQENRRVSDMFAALSATNTAILRAQTEDEMFRLVCESVAKGGRSLGAAAVFLKQTDSPMLKMVAAAGELVQLIEKMPLSIDPGDPYGHGLHGPAFREQKLFISHDTATDPRTQLWECAGRSAAWMCGRASRQEGAIRRHIVLLLRPQRRPGRRRHQPAHERHCRERFLWSGNVRTRAADPAYRSHACGAQRHQRSHRPRQKPERIV
jgi:GAF domain-containing protein